MRADAAEPAERGERGAEPDAVELLYFRFVVEETGEIDEFDMTRAEIDALYPGPASGWVEMPDDAGEGGWEDRWEGDTIDPILAEWAEQRGDFELDGWR